MTDLDMSVKGWGFTEDKVTAFVAAKAIQDRHFVEDTGTRWACGCCREDHPCEDHEYAGVVLARLNEATQHLEAIRSSWFDSGVFDPEMYEHAVAALALLRDDTKDTP